MSNTIICPMSWCTYIDVLRISSRNPMGDNNVWVGWNPTQYFVPIIKFDTSGLSVIPAHHSIKAKMFFRSGQPGPTFISPIECTVWEIIKPATADAHWIDYDLTNAWTTPGASTPDSDYKSTAMGTFTISASNTWFYAEMGQQAIRSLYTSNRPIMVTPPVGLSSYSYTQIYTRTFYPEYYPYIEVIYSTSGLVGDATMF